MFSKTYKTNGITLLLLSLLVPACLQAQTSVAGIWQGVLDAGNAKLRIVFSITTAADSTLSATMDSPDQGAKGIPVSKVLIANDSLVIDMPSIGGKYEGVIQKNRNSITGKWKQAGYEFPLTLTRSESVPEVLRPQLPKKPYPYLEEEVSYQNTVAGITLAGTLTKPSTGGPFPAVILITGSGPQDRNESLMGHSPFLILADYLTRRGIAVLRVDDRGVGGSTGNVAQSTSADFAGDVLVGVNYLKRRSDIRGDKIGLIGHSEGGIVAPMAASQSTDVAFIVLMAGTGLPGDELLQMQTALIMKKSGAPEEIIQKALDNNEKIFAIVKTEKDTTQLRSKLAADLAARWDEWEKEYEQQGIEKSAAIERTLSLAASRWGWYFINLDPRLALRKVKCPVLAINGELDVQVPPKENLGEIERTLKAGGNNNVTIQELPGLNHLFQTAKTGLPLEYGSIEETMSPAALKVIGDWVERQALKQE